MIYEIRNYYYEPSRLQEYRVWADTQALHYLRNNLDVVGFWITGDEPGEVHGEPLDELGSPNVTWIIRWPDIETRHETMTEVLGSNAWKAIFANSPGRENYRRVEITYAEGL